MMKSWSVHYQLENSWLLFFFDAGFRSNLLELQDTPSRLKKIKTNKTALKYTKTFCRKMARMYHICLPATMGNLAKSILASPYPSSIRKDINIYCYLYFFQIPIAVSRTEAMAFIRIHWILSSPRRSILAKSEANRATALVKKPPWTCRLEAFNSNIAPSTCLAALVGTFTGKSATFFQG